MNSPVDYEQYSEDDDRSPSVILWVIGSCIVALIFLLAWIQPWAKAHASTIVDVAISELGHGEIGCDNCGPDVKRYTRGQEVAWCAGLVSYVLQKAGNKTFPYYLSSISYWKTAKDRGITTDKPRAGYLFVQWRKQIDPLVHGHIGIVEKVEGDTIMTIEGNTGDFPSKVRRKVYRNGIPRLLGYIKI